MSAPFTVRLDQIEVDDGLQPRCDGLIEEHIDALLETPETWPAIVLARVRGSLILVDGFHRYEAAQRLGAESIVASVFDPPEGADLFGYAFEFNAKHGRPLTLRDRKRYAVTLLRDHAELADREIGRRCGLHHETVGALRDEQPRNIRIPARKPGELPGAVGLLDPIRRKNATREQKTIAGYVARLAIALGDPYQDEAVADWWSDDPLNVARACVLAMGPKRASDTLGTIESDARFMLQVAKAARTFAKEIAS